LYELINIRTVGPTLLISLACGTDKCKVNEKGKFIPVHARKAYRGAEVKLYYFLTLALDGGDQSTSHPNHVTSGKDNRISLKRLS